MAVDQDPVAVIHAVFDEICCAVKMQGNVEAGVVASENHFVGELVGVGRAELGGRAQNVADLASAQQGYILRVVVVAEVKLWKNPVHP